jgi:hypothetical protein
VFSSSALSFQWAIYNFGDKFLQNNLLENVVVDTRSTSKASIPNIKGRITMFEHTSQPSQFTTMVVALHTLHSLLTLGKRDAGVEIGSCRDRTRLLLEYRRTFVVRTYLCS